MSSSSKSAVSSAPDEILHYPIASDDATGGRLFLYYGGNEKKKKKAAAAVKHVLLFCPGFPDDHGAFASLASRLSNELPDALCGVTCLPGFDDAPPSRPWTSFNEDGYTFEEWTAALRTAAKLLRERTSETATYTTVFHDWGSLAGCFYTNRALQEGDALTKPDQIVYFDVLPSFVHPSASNKPEPEKKSLKKRASEVLYRLVFAKSFLLQRYVSKTLGLMSFGIGMALLGAVGLSPSLKNNPDEAVMKTELPPDDKPRLYRLVYQMFPYWNLVKEMVFGGGKSSALADQFHLPKLDETPVLFMYGPQKNCTFHDDNVANWLKQYNKCDSIAVPGTAHWLYRTNEDACVDAVKRFVLAKK